MTQLYLPDVRPPVIPIIGPNVLDLSVRHRDSEGQEEGRGRLFTENGLERWRSIADYLGAALVISAVSFGPVMGWLLVR
jgi:hypothetical protein